MSLTVSKARFWLYCAFLLWSFLLFALSIARLSYTTHLPKGDTLNGGKNFYDPSVAALLVTSIISIIFATVILWILHTEWMHRFLTLVYVELVVVVGLWFLLLGSTAAATNVWPNLSFCIQFRACTNLQAMLAFGWLAWISLTLILLVTVVSAYRSRAWQDHIHSIWSDRHVFWSGARFPMPDYDSRSRSNVSRSNVSANAGPSMRMTEAV